MTKRGRPPKQQSITADVAPERATVVRGTGITPEEETGAGVAGVVEQYKGEAPAPGGQADADEKRARRRAREKERNAAAQAASGADQLAGDLALLSGLLLDIALPRMPNPLPASPLEREIFTRTVANVARKYAPGMEQWGAEIALVLAAGMIAIPRFIVADKAGNVKPIEPDKETAPIPDGAPVVLGEPIQAAVPGPGEVSK